MKRLKLAVEERKVLGKKVKKLRKDNILPANIYGKNVKSIAVQVPYKEFEKAYKEAGETGLIDVEIGKEIKPSLIHNVQQDYYNHRLLHADFYQVDLKTKVKTMVPLVTIGEAKAVSDKLGLLLQPLSSIEVEALPTELPERIEVNVESLAIVGAQLTVGELKTPSGVTILTDSSQVVAKIGELVSKEAAEQAAAEQAAAQAAKAATAPTGAEGTAQGAAAPATEAAKPTPGESAAKPETPRQAPTGQSKPQK